MAVIKVWPVLASRILRSWLGESEAHAGVQEPVTHLRKLFFAEGLHENNVYVNLRKFEPRFRRIYVGFFAGGSTRKPHLRKFAPLGFYNIKRD